MVQLSHPYLTTGKTIALTRQTFVGKVMSLLLNLLSRLVIAFLPRSTAATAAKSLQSCPTLCDSIDGSPPGSLVPGIIQARTLEWGAIACSHGIKRCFLLGRKAMTNLDSILESRDITLPTKIHLVKANKGPCSQSYGFCRSHVWV